MRLFRLVVALGRRQRVQLLGTAAFRRASKRLLGLQYPHLEVFQLLLILRDRTNFRRALLAVLHTIFSTQCLFFFLPTSHPSLGHELSCPTQLRLVVSLGVSAP